MPTTSPSSTDPTLLREVKADDPVGKKKLAEWVGPLIAYWSRSLAMQDREEVIQDVFLQLRREGCDRINQVQQRRRIASIASDAAGPTARNFNRGVPRCFDR